MTTKMFSTKNTSENWNNFIKAEKNSSFDGGLAVAVVKMENEMASSLDIREGQANSNSRSNSPVESQSNGDGIENKLLRVDTKICGVCGDKALGNNFNAITCESCKAFFRRNALKTKESTCPFSNSCKVDPVTRRFCQKCRLKKCFDIGMKKEWIMTDEEKKIKKIKIEQNRLKRQSSDALPSPSQSSSDSPPVPKAPCLIESKYPYPTPSPSNQSSPSPSPSPSFPQHPHQIDHQQHHQLLVLPQNSPPDPTLPHKIGKQPMMPHNCDEPALSSPLPSPSPSAATTSVSLIHPQQLSPMSMPMQQMNANLPSPSPASISATSAKTANIQHCYSAGSGSGPIVDSSFGSSSCNRFVGGSSSGSSSTGPAAVGLNLNNGSNNQHPNQAFIQQLNYDSNSNISCASPAATVAPGALSMSTWCDSNVNNPSGASCAIRNERTSVASAVSRRTVGAHGVLGVGNSLDGESQNHVQLNLREQNHGNQNGTGIPNYTNDGNGNGTANTSVNTNLGHGQPLPLLASLIRPGTTESPVSEAQFISEYRNGNSSNIPLSFQLQKTPNTNLNINANSMVPQEGQGQNHSQTSTSLATLRTELSEHQMPTLSPTSPIFSSIRNANKMSNGNGSGGSYIGISGKSDLMSVGVGVGDGYQTSSYCPDATDTERQGQSGQSRMNKNKRNGSASVVSVVGNANGVGVGGILGDESFSLNLSDVLGGGNEDRIYASGSEQELMCHPLNAMDSIMNIAITAEFNGNVLGLGGGGGSRIVRGCGGLGSGIVGGSHSTSLNPAEQSKLDELLRASEALNAPVDAERPVKFHDPSLINVINLTDIAIRRLIQMSKKISGFKNMCQEDQVALLKGSCTEMMILRSVVSYDPDRDSWNIPHSNVGYNIQLGVLKEARGNLYEEHQRFVKSFRSEWRSNENIMMILCAITLFTSERTNVIHKEAVQLEQHSYVYLLKRYLESTMNGCEARSTYLQLIRKIQELHVLNTNHLRVFLEVNPREVEPLLIEIFDMK